MRMLMVMVMVVTGDFLFINILKCFLLEGMALEGKEQ